MEAKNNTSAKPRQIVAVAYPATSLTRDTFYVYFLSLLTMFAGFVIAYFLSPSAGIHYQPEHIGHVFAGIGFAIGFVLTSHLL